MAARTDGTHGRNTGPDNRGDGTGVGGDRTHSVAALSGGVGAVVSAVAALRTTAGGAPCDGGRNGSGGAAVAERVLLWPLVRNARHGAARSVDQVPQAQHCVRAAVRVGNLLYINIVVKASQKLVHKNYL